MPLVDGSRLVLVLLVNGSRLVLVPLVDALVPKLDAGDGAGIDAGFDADGAIGDAGAEKRRGAGPGPPDAVADAGVEEGAPRLWCQLTAAFGAGADAGANPPSWKRAPTAPMPVLALALLECEEVRMRRGGSGDGASAAGSAGSGDGARANAGAPPSGGFGRRWFRRPRRRHHCRWFRRLRRRRQGRRRCHSVLRLRETLPLPLVPAALETAPRYVGARAVGSCFPAPRHPPP